MIPRRLEARLSNATGGSKVFVRGVVTDNIVASSGKILVEAGTTGARGGVYRRAHRDE
jgi:hypothetical protein